MNDIQRLRDYSSRLDTIEREILKRPVHHESAMIRNCISRAMERMGSARTMLDAAIRELEREQ